MSARTLLEARRPVRRVLRRRRRQARPRPRRFRAVDGVTLSARARRDAGIVGESGSGKSTLGRAMLGLLPATSGRVVFEGDDVADRRTREGSEARDRDGLPGPFDALNPRMTVGATIAEVLRVHGKIAARARRRGRRAPDAPGGPVARARRAKAERRSPAASASASALPARSLSSRARNRRRMRRRPRRLDPGPDRQLFMSSGASASSRSCSSPTTSPWCAASASAWPSCIWGGSSRRARPSASSPRRATPTRRRSCARFPSIDPARRFPPDLLAGEPPSPSSRPRVALFIRAAPMPVMRAGPARRRP